MFEFTFSCSNWGGCDATDDSTKEGGSQYYSCTRSGYLRGQVIRADDTYVLDDFSVYLDPYSSCTSVDFCVLSGSSTSSWTEEYNSTRTLSSTDAGWINSGMDMGVTTNSGAYYALVATWTCSSTYYYEYDCNDADGGFGTITGYIYYSAYTGSFPSSPNYSSSSLRIKTTVNYR